jgi:hypothetical protein
MNSAPFSRDARISRAPDAVWRDLDGRAAVISLDEGRIRTMNTTATFVWSLLDAAPSIDAIQTRLAERFPRVPSDELAHDLDLFLHDMVTRGLVRVLPPASA